MTSLRCARWGYRCQSRRLRQVVRRSSIRSGQPSLEAQLVVDSTADATVVVLESSGEFVGVSQPDREPDSDVAHRGWRWLRRGRSDMAVSRRRRIRSPNPSIAWSGLLERPRCAVRFYGRRV